MINEDYINETDDENLLPDTEQELYERFRFVADKGQNLLRIDRYLVDKMANVSRNRIQEAAEAGSIRVNEKSVKSNYRIKPSDVVSIYLTCPPRSYEIVPQNIPVNIVYEDDYIMLINKRPGMVVHPGVGNYDATLLNAIACHLQNNSEIDLNDPRIGLVHRIDKDTSGLLLIAKTPEAKTDLGKQFFEKTTERLYQALVWGLPKEAQGTIVGDLARDPHNRLIYTVFPEGENPLAKHAVTHYKVLEQLGYVSLVECKLETGRTHQIRVHMKHLGHPLFNDKQYGGNIILRGTASAGYNLFVKNCFLNCPRQALHAKTLGFTHPHSGERMFFDSLLPDDMQLLLDNWRCYVKEKM
jgi:23S rRNA pseudouridine1911/1915/1917 synthase